MFSHVLFLTAGLGDDAFATILRPIAIFVALESDVAAARSRCTEVAVNFQRIMTTQLSSNSPVVSQEEVNEEERD